MEPHLFPGHTVQVTDSDGHRALISQSSFAAGDLVLTVRGNVMTTPTRYSLQVGPDTHVAPLKIQRDSELHDDFLWPFMNHSFSPSVKIVGLEVIAVRDMRPGDELCFDYNTTEWDMESPFHCLENGGLVRGYRYLSTADREAIREITAPHLIERAKVESELADSP